MITGEQVKAAALSARIAIVPSRDCSLCGYMCSYVIRDDGNLYYDPGCYCTNRRGGREPRSWDDAANWINIQSDDDQREKIMRRFGFVREITAADLGLPE